MTLVTGDPASMRAAAAQLRLRSEVLDAAAVRVDGLVAGMTYAGPAAERFRGAISTHSSGLRSVSARMVSTADVLVRQAALVEEQMLTQASQEAY